MYDSVWSIDTTYSTCFMAAALLFHVIFPASRSCGKRQKRVKTWIQPSETINDQRRNGDSFNGDA